MTPWTEERRKRHREYMKKYYVKNVKKMYAAARRSKELHGNGWPSQTRIKRREYEKRCLERRRLDPVKWARHQELAKAAAKRATIRLKFQVINHYGGKCICCGETLLGLLTMDHINE